MTARNVKNQHIYNVISLRIINATNAQDGQAMVLYERDGQFFVREKDEFYKKFLMEEVENECLDL
jgi:hypothetical protein